MRKNQITIRVDRFEDQVPDKYEKNIQTIRVYADSNNVFEALSAAYCEIINELRKYENIPSFGCVESSNNLEENWFC